MPLCLHRVPTQWSKTKEAELPTKPGEVKEFSSGSSSSVLHDHIIIIITAVAIIVYEMMDDD